MHLITIKNYHNVKKKYIDLKKKNVYDPGLFLRKL